MLARSYAISAALAAGAVPMLLFGFSSGPPIMRTGAAVDGGQNCTVCHTSFSVNDDSGGSVVIRANAYTPGVKQVIEVQVSHPTARRWGFQLIARLASDETKQAGTFEVDDNIRVRCAPSGDAPCNGGLEFAEHKQPTTNAGNPGPRTFLIEWTPPATDVGAINLYAAGNAANGDGTPSGDHIYTTKTTIMPASAGGAALSLLSSSISIAPYSWVKITGSRLATGNRAWTSADIVNGALPTSLDGTSVAINGKPAYVAMVSPSQVNALAPLDDTVGPVTVTVTTNGTVTQTSTAYMQAAVPALFATSSEAAIAQHADYSLVNADSPAKPGETIILYASGCGATNPPVSAGQLVSAPAPLATMPVIRIGGTNVTPEFAGLTASGLYQINVKIPDTAADGDLAIVATANGVSSPGSVKIRVQH